MSNIFSRDHGDGILSTPSFSDNNGSRNILKSLCVSQNSILSHGKEVCKQETTQSLTFRLLGIDVGYSSDEGGDEECAYFLDGLDTTFSSREEANFHSYMTDIKDNEKSNDTNPSACLPVKSSEFSAVGERTKLFSAIMLSSQLPEYDDFDNYPLPSKKELEALKKVETILKHKITLSSVELQLSHSEFKTLNHPFKEFGLIFLFYTFGQPQIFFFCIIVVNGQLVVVHGCIYLNFYFCLCFFQLSFGLIQTNFCFLGTGVSTQRTEDRNFNIQAQQ
jgi:hypothetical protein